ncbi:ArsR family transcriptional regulator [Candidatus Bathyarchaeota archaeon]|nr:MAG: ArsR family transcriptional regulator [Candidatus Bathyarchaeota archaeon]
MSAEDVRRKLRALSKKHSLEIVATLFKGGKKYASQLSKELGLPYTTVQQRINELEAAGLVRCTSTLHPLSRRPIREVEALNFQILLSPRSIQQLVEGGSVKGGFRVWTGRKREMAETP